MSSESWIMSILIVAVVILVVIIGLLVVNLRKGDKR
jgi:phosphate starvation-inducible membrane PsiE